MGHEVEIDKGRVRDNGRVRHAEKPGASLPASSNAAPPSQSFSIEGRLPGLNEILSAAVRRACKWNAYDDMKRSYGEYICTMIRNHHLAPMQRVAISFEWIEPNRKRDKDNIAVAKKFILDALVEMKVISNDGWKNIESMHDTFSVDRHNPRVVVRMEAR